MSATAKLFMHGRSQAVRLPKEFRFEGTEMRISKVGDKVILEPTESSVMPWALIDGTGDSPFLPEGREQQEMSTANFDSAANPKPPLQIDVEAWFARLDELGARDFLPDGIPDDMPMEPDPRTLGEGPE